MLRGDGEAARMMRATDSAATPLGPVEGWPPGLGSIVATSTNDPLGDPAILRAFADDWGSRVIDLGPVGHLNPAVVEKVTEALTQTGTLFVTPSRLIPLEERLLKRGEEEWKRRMASVKEIMAALPRFDYLIVNDDLADAEQTIYSIVVAESHRAPEGKEGEAFLERFYQQ